MIFVASLLLLLLLLPYGSSSLVNRMSFRFQDNSSTDIFVYDTSSTDISSTDISFTTVYQRVGQLYVHLLFQQIIISSIPTSTFTMIPFYQSRFHLHYDNTTQ